MSPPSWVFPAIAASTWLGEGLQVSTVALDNDLTLHLAMLLAMLGHWTMIGEPRYGLMKPGQNIP